MWGGVGRHGCGVAGASAARWSAPCAPTPRNPSLHRPFSSDAYESPEEPKLTYTSAQRAAVLGAIRACGDGAPPAAAMACDVVGTTWRRAVKALRSQLMNNPERLFASQEELDAFAAACAEAGAAGWHRASTPLPAARALRLAAAGKHAEETDQEDAATPTTRELRQGLVAGAVEAAHRALASEVTAARLMRLSADLRLPHLWYPEARLLRRRVIYHAGPTNSGKTYNAMQALRAAGSGVYCGPLRLLALEIYEALNRDGVYASLLTGQERREVPFAEHVSCTVEMTDVSRRVDCAVIDEIQMIADPGRGHAWTRALLGVQAAEVHVCGDPSVLPVVRAICEITGDDFEVRTYERLTKLSVATESLGGSFASVRPGDCVVAFSRREIYAIRRLIEQSTPHRCCVVYGALPPETRSAQARLFNTEGTGWDVLVASDAVGMGLNLNIGRVIFSSLRKFDGRTTGPVPPPLVKQIGGRAGRHGTLYPDGAVTALHDDDIPYLQEAMAAAPPVVTAAGLFPNIEQVQVFADAAPGARLSTLLDRFVESAHLDGTYFMCRAEDMKKAAEALAAVPLSLADLFTMCQAPVNVRNAEARAWFARYAAAFATGQEVGVGVQLPLREPSTAVDLEALEAKHQALETYLWMSQRWPDQFKQREYATALRERAIEMIEVGLHALSEQAAARWEQRQQRRRQREARRRRGAGNRRSKAQQQR